MRLLEQWCIVGIHSLATACETILQQASCAKATMASDILPSPGSQAPSRAVNHVAFNLPAAWGGVPPSTGHSLVLC